MDRDYPFEESPLKSFDNQMKPDKYHKIIKSWDVLDKSAKRNYYGEEPIPFVVDSLQKGN